MVNGEGTQPSQEQRGQRKSHDQNTASGTTTTTVQVSLLLGRGAVGQLLISKEATKLTPVSRVCEDYSTECMHQFFTNSPTPIFIPSLGGPLLGSALTSARLGHRCFLGFDLGAP